MDISEYANGPNRTIYVIHQPRSSKLYQRVESLEDYQTITYWRTTQPKLAWMALNILIILATSDDRERAFSEAGDLLEPLLSKLRANIIAAL